MSMTRSQLEEIIRNAIEAHDAANAAKRVSEPQEANSTHVLNCPECFKDFVGKLKETSEVQCRDCGLPLGSREFAQKLDSCPACHGKDTRKIERKIER